MSESQKPFGGPLPVLGDQIRQWRLARKVTQSELEQKAGLSHNTVSRIECGSVSPRIDTLDRIAQSLDVSVEQLQFQQPKSEISESQSRYQVNENTADLVAALEQIPEPKRRDLLRTFMDLVRIAAGEHDV